MAKATPNAPVRKTPVRMSSLSDTSLAAVVRKRLLATIRPLSERASMKDAFDSIISAISQLGSVKDEPAASSAAGVNNAK